MISNDEVTTVPLSELEILKRKAEEIKKRIEEFSQPTSIATFCEKRPYNLPSFKANDARNPVVFDKLVDLDVWKHFLALAKHIHTKNGIFVQRGMSYPRTYFFVEEHGKLVPTRVTDLSREEVIISAKMLDEMISIYNKYMVKLHTEVMFRDAEGVLKAVPVQLPEEHCISTNNTEES